jgi:hypothetical protein
MKVGIICERSYQRSLLIENYFYIIKNLYNNLKEIKNLEDLTDINLLFIGNDHFGYHTNIWLNEDFLQKCNNKKIKVVIIGGEKILNTHYAHNARIQKSIEKLNDYHQYVWDVEDSKIMNKKIIGYPISKHYEQFFKCSEKNNKCLFIGRYDNSDYKERFHVLNEINKYVETDIMTNISNNWQDYLNMYCQYKYSLCPLSTYSNGIPTRFYEALLTNCIPILQVKEDTLDYYPDEAAIPEAIFFKNVEELKEKIANHKYSKCESKLWGEDKYKKLFIEDGIPVPQ